MTALSDELKPCPFCGNPLTLKVGRANPSGRCETEGCTAASLPVLNLDDPQRIAAWNRRAALEAEPQDGDVEQALNRMDALLDPSLNLLAVSEDSITLQGCRADMLTIRRALRMAPAAREGWQPIETAPKEWILLLGYFNESGKWRTVRGEWFCQEEIDDQWEFPENGSPGWYETCVNADEPPNCWPIEPTHWMPLPTPPKD